MITSSQEQMSMHLQFLGYETSRDGDRIVARHPVKFNISIRSLAGGVLLTAVIGSGDNAKHNRSGYLNLINSLNVGAAVARFYADSDSDLFIEAWHPDSYDRTGFGIFMEQWFRDCNMLVENSETSKYL